MNRTPAILLLLIVAIALGAWLRARSVATLPLWYDEADTWNASVGTGNEPMPYSKYFLWENHFETAPLTFLLVRLSTDITGSVEPWVMRLPSLLAGILCIPAMFWLGRVVHSNALGLAAAALIACDPNQVDQSQQCRMYTLLTLFTITALAMVIPLLRDPDGGLGDTKSRWLPRLWRWLALGVAFGLLLCVQQLAVAVWIGVALGAGGLLTMGLLTKQPHPKWRKIAAGLTVAYLVGIALANIGVYKMVHRVLYGGPGEGAHLTLTELAREIATAAKDLISPNPVGLIVYPLASLGIVLLFRKCKTSTAVLAGLTAVTIALLFKFRKMHHFLDHRYLSPLQPALWIGLAMLTVGFGAARLRQASVALLVVYMGLQTYQCLNLTPYYMQPDRYLFAEMMLDVRDGLKPGETTSIHPGPARLLGAYYKLPQDRTLFEGLYNPGDDQPRQKQAVPSELKAEAVWLIMGMNNHDERLAKARRTLDLIAAHYGTKVDPAEMETHLKKERVAAARITAAGVELRSIGVRD